MPAALIGGVIAGAGAIGSAVIGSSAQNKAANTAAQATQDTTNANNALAREVYGQNKATLSPYVNTGYAATNALSALLGLNTGGAQSQQQPAGNTVNSLGSTTQYGDYGLSLEDLRGLARYSGYELPTDVGARPYAPYYEAQTTPVQTATPDTTQNYQQAFDNYRNSTGYQFRVNEGMKALNTGYAARGMIQSGAAQKAALQYGQNIASGEFNNYLSQLGSQQGVGLSAGNALAGVSTNYANQVAGQNNAQAGVLANMALAKGQNTANLWGTVGNTIGNVAGNIFSSYR